MTEQDYAARVRETIFPGVAMSLAVFGKPPTQVPNEKWDVAAVVTGYWRRVLPSLLGAPAPSEPDAVVRAAMELIAAYDANVDAINGGGHDGEPHDRMLHHGPAINGIEIFDAVGDCAACGGAQYGTEDRLQQAIVAMKAALGLALRPYEEWRNGELPLTEQDYAARVRALTEALAMARSIALSGERWTEQAEATYRAALAAPAPSEPGLDEETLARAMGGLTERLGIEWWREPITGAASLLAAEYARRRGGL